MPGLGTIINVAAIVAAGLLGAAAGKLMNERLQDGLAKASGICVLFIGISGCLSEMYKITASGLEAGGTMMMIVCFALGALFGELLNLESRFEQFGECLKRKTGREGDTGFVGGFVTASLTVCIGAMAVVGSIQDGTLGDYSTLSAKAVLDLIIIMVMTASFGKGCIFSAIPVAIFQGAITLLATFIEPIMTPQALSNLSLTGNILIFCVGLNLVWGKKIKVANLLPTIVFAVIWAFLPLG